MATTRELTLKFNHENDETSSIKFGNLSNAATESLKAKIKAINNGEIEYDGATREVAYQRALFNKSGSPATKIAEASLVVETTSRVYTQGQD